MCVTLIPELLIACLKPSRALFPCATEFTAFNLCCINILDPVRRNVQAKEKKTYSRIRNKPLLKFKKKWGKEKK